MCIHVLLTVEQHVHEVRGDALESGTWLPVVRGFLEVGRFPRLLITQLDENKCARRVAIL